jgi:hypothetical protein
MEPRQVPLPCLLRPAFADKMPTSAQSSALLRILHTSFIHRVALQYRGTRCLAANQAVCFHIVFISDPRSSAVALLVFMGREAVNRARRVRKPTVACLIVLTSTKTQLMNGNGPSRWPLEA